MKPVAMLKNPVGLFVIAVVTAGCGTLAPESVPGLRRIIGPDLIGTRGATIADQDNIDVTIVRSCAAGIFTKKECADHGRLTQAE